MDYDKKKQNIHVQVGNFAKSIFWMVILRNPLFAMANSQFSLNLIDDQKGIKDRTNKTYTCSNKLVLLNPSCSLELIVW